MDQSRGSAACCQLPSNFFAWRTKSFLFLFWWKLARRRTLRMLLRSTLAGLLLYGVLPGLSHMTGAGLLADFFPDQKLTYRWFPFWFTSEITWSSEKDVVLKQIAFLWFCIYPFFFFFKGRENQWYRLFWDSFQWSESESKKEVVPCQ